MSKPTALFTDFYQIAMMYGYFKAGKHQQKAVYNSFFRKNPFGNGYTLTAGLENSIQYLKNLRFEEEQIYYLRQNTHLKDEKFFDYLKGFRFTGDYYAMPEGTVAFPSEPMLTVVANLPEAQLIESALLNINGQQSLIATKASRVRLAAGAEASLLEFGLRRAQGADAANDGARASFIGGFNGTSNVEEAMRLGIQAVGTHAHSWVQSFPTELKAFQTWLEYFPDNGILLVDTYDVRKSGIPNAIKAFQELVLRLGRKPLYYGIRLDSGDLAYLSKYARKKLDESGFEDAKIIVSNDLNERLITELRIQGAQIDGYGVGTNLITAEGTPALGNVYKLVEVEESGGWVPKIKISENPEKVTNPGRQRVIRFLDEKGEATADLLVEANEVIPQQPFEIFHPVYTNKRKVLSEVSAQELLVPIFQNGELIYDSPTIFEIQKQAKQNLTRFSEEHLRLLNPHEYHVDLSQALWDKKMKLLQLF